MTAIYRYEVPVDDSRHRIRLFGDPTGVGCRRTGIVEFWATHDDGASLGAERSFLVVGTGHQLPHDAVKVWGHAYDMGGALVWHLVEVTS